GLFHSAGVEVGSTGRDGTRSSGADALSSRRAAELRDDGARDRRRRRRMIGDVTGRAEEGTCGRYRAARARLARDARTPGASAPRDGVNGAVVLEVDGEFRIIPAGDRRVAHRAL